MPVGQTNGWMKVIDHAEPRGIAKELAHILPVLYTFDHV